jgi:uncharacterized protein with HEPN domain
MNDDAELLHSLRAAADRLSSGGAPDVPDSLNDLLTIADAAEALSPRFRRRHPDVPWMVLAELGRVVRRAGSGLDRPMLAVTIERDLPELAQRLADL